MKNVLIFGDLHINQSSLKECFSILEEISQLVKKYSVDTVISLGDTFDSINPSADELDLLSVFVRKINIDMILLAADSHESITQSSSVINHFGILNEKITVVKEFKDGNHLYCGHFIIKESNINYGAKLSKEDLKQYLYIFLGHAHSYQHIKPNIVHLGCYDKETEILTNNGWKYFKDLDKTEKVATLNSKTNKIEYQYPTNYYSYNYNGKMYEIAQNYLNLCVTPNHNIYCKIKGKNNFELISAEKIFKRNEKTIPRNHKSMYQSSPNNFILPKYTNNYYSGKGYKLQEYYQSSKKIPFELYVKFMSWYLSEGSFDKNCVTITQKKHYTEVKIIVEELIKYLNCNYSISIDKRSNTPKFIIYSTQLTSYLKQFGKAKDKFIPNIIKNSHKQYLKLFLDTYIRGDGCVTNHSTVITSISKKMLNDLQEIYFKLGLSSRIFKDTIYFHKRKNSLIKPIHENWSFYKDMVYCVEVPNHIIYVRRKGISYWCGNSSRYVDFAEAKDKQKIIALITDYDNDAEKVHFLKLKSPIPMMQLDLQKKDLKNSPKEAISDTILSKNKDSDKDTFQPILEQIASTNPLNPSQIDLLCQQLDKLNQNTKVKVKIKDFESFKAFLPLENKYKEKFVKFVRENDFELISDKPITAKSEINLKQSFEEFAKEKEIDKEIKDIIKGEIK